MSRPAGSGRPPARTGNPAGRTLTALVVGHAAVLAGAVAAAVLVLADERAQAVDDGLTGSASTVLDAGLLVAGLGALAVGQVLSLRRLTTHVRAVATGRLDEPVLAAGVRRIGRSVVLAFYPLILGLLHVVLNPPPPALLAAVVAVIAASLLLDLGHAAWTYRHLPHTTGVRLLPPGSRARIHAGQNVTAALYVGLAAVGVALLVATALGEIERPAPAPLATATQLGAAVAVVLVALLLVRPVRRVSAAIVTDDRGSDVVHLAALDRAARPFVRLRVLCAFAAALAAAALLAAPASPALAATRAVPLLLVLGSAALQLGSLTSINLADTAHPGRPRRRGAG